MSRIRTGRLPARPRNKNTATKINFKHSPLQPPEREHRERLPRRAYF
jgi:hypothetical protein